MAGAGNHSDKLVKEENIMKSIKDLKLESLNIPKFAAERIDPENVSELSDDELVRLGVTTIGDHDPHRICANAEKKNISLWLQLLLANAWLFSADVVTFVCLASRHQLRIPSSTEKRVLFHAGLWLSQFQACPFPRAFVGHLSFLVLETEQQMLHGGAGRS